MVIWEQERLYLRRALLVQCKLKKINIIKEYYSGELPLFHIDAYRVEDRADELGLEEYFHKGGIVIIEWADMIRDYLPEERLEIKIRAMDSDEDGRIITINPIGPKYEELCEAVL